MEALVTSVSRVSKLSYGGWIKGFLGDTYNVDLLSERASLPSRLGLYPQLYPVTLNPKP